MAIFRQKNVLKKVCYKVSLCENCQQQSCKASSAYLSLQKQLLWTSPSTWKFVRKRPTLFKNADFQLTFSRSASAVKPNKKVH